MSAPARVPGPVPRTRTRTAVPPRERGTGKPAAQPERTAATRSRSAAAERAYERRAQRTQRGTESPAPRVERRTGSASRVSFVLLVMGLLVVGVVATLWFATQSTADAYRLEQAKKNTGQLSGQVAKLQQQVAQEDSPPSLAQKAQQLGMVPAGDPAHLVVGPNGAVTMVGTPSAAQPPAPASPPPSGSTSPATSTSPVTPPAGG
jgi:hypothetical protein